MSDLQVSPCALNGQTKEWGGFGANGTIEQLPELSVDNTCSFTVLDSEWVDGDIPTAGGIGLSADRAGNDIPTAGGPRDLAISISVPKGGVVDPWFADCAVAAAFPPVVIGELLDVVACLGLKKLRMSQLLPAIEADLFGGISTHLRGVTVRAMESRGSFRTG